MSRFKVGDRVRLRLSSEFYYQYEQWKNSVGLITGIDALGWWQVESGTYKQTYQDRDLNLVTKGGEEVKPYQRKTYMLKVESPSLLKGALVQERCDDGTQPYDLINAETHSKDPSFNVSFAKRELVEDAPKFWVEVFKVQPEYMTQPELDQWQAFKSRKKPGRKPAVKAVAEKPAKKSKYSKSNRSAAMRASWARRKAQKAA